MFESYIIINYGCLLLLLFQEDICCNFNFQNLLHYIFSINLYAYLHFKTMSAVLVLTEPYKGILGHCLAAIYQQTTSHEHIEYSY